jgi:hypothetical protein
MESTGLKGQAFARSSDRAGGRLWASFQKQFLEKQLSRTPASTRRTIWGALITAMFYISVVVGSLLPGLKPRLHAHRSLHLPMHFATYVLSALLTFGFAPWRGQQVLSCAAPVSLAFVTEALECEIYGIRFEWRDIVTDIVGVLAGAVFFLTISHLIRSSTAASRGVASPGASLNDARLHKT